MADQQPKEKPKKEGGHPSLASTAHAVHLTQTWTPTLARSQSWTPEDRKRDMQMGIMGGGLPENYSQIRERSREI